MPIPGLASALGAIASSGISSASSFFGVNNANAMNAEQALAQMNFQMNMSNSAHQREVKDLRKAGLNPILSATGGSGASTPSGASANMVNPAQDIPDIINSAQMNYRANRQQKYELGLIKGQTDAQYSSAEKSRSDIEVNNEVKKTQLTQQLVNSATAEKTLQDKLNSILMTNAQVKNLNSISKYTNERARGYSTTNNSSIGTGSGLNVMGNGMHWNLSRSRQKSRSW